MHRPFPRNRKVWLFMSILVFLAAWLLPTVEGADGRMPAGEVWYDFITRDYVCSPGQILVMLAVLTCCFALLGAVVGWLLQFPICIVWKYFRRGHRRRPPV